MDEKKWTNYLYYILIGVLSFVALLFLPMVGSEIGMSFNFPTTVAGWFVYIVSQLITAVINVLIFHSFIKQSRLNIKDDTNYLKAVQILQLNKSKTYIPRSLTQLNKREYGVKGITIFLSSILATIALGEAILTYNYVKLLTYLFVIIMGIVFGVLEMKKYEEYYTGEYLDYALMVEAKRLAEEAEGKVFDEADDIADVVGGVDVLEPVDSVGGIGDNS